MIRAGRPYAVRADLTPYRMNSVHPPGRSPSMGTARFRARSRTWLRVLVLLLALLVPGTHAHAHALPVVAEAAEHDALDTALRPPARTARHTDVRPAPVPRSRPAPPGTPASPPRCAPPGPPYVPHILRTVVLRC
ncbi:hypothetical protein GCM10018780_38810 [Streptomyces lanatus]|nr:hypothetical protein GCM10018780_38810 [Streptomyces lanatus]